MYEHHQQSLEKLVSILKDDPEFLAIITAGSIAQGKAREESDIDVYLVLTDEAYEQRAQTYDLAYNNKDVCNYPEGYIDGKMINLRFLELAATRGSEPTRYSFLGSQVIWSRIPQLDELIRRIPVYPEENHERNIKDFYAQIFLYAFYFSAEAAKKDNPYLMLHAASNVALFGSRIILACNRMLFPCHKGLMEAVQAAPNKPEKYTQQLRELLAKPDMERCMEFAKMLLAYYNPNMPFEQAVSLFVTNNEWNWLEHEPPIADR